MAYCALAIVGVFVCLITLPTSYAVINALQRFYEAESIGAHGWITVSGVSLGAALALVIGQFGRVRLRRVVSQGRKNKGVAVRS